MSKQILRLSPSGSSRWLTCTASPQFILANQDRIEEEDTTSEYAKEGTLAHDRAAECLMLGFDEEIFEGNDEMMEHVRGYCDYIDSKRIKGDKLFVEEKLQPWYLVKEKNYDGDVRHVTHGYSDCNLVHKDHLTIIDLKYGAGVSVQAEENTQLVIYAMSKVFKLLQSGFKFSKKAEVTLAIYQPRVNGQEAVREWTISMEELREIASDIYDTAKLILKGKGTKFAPSDKACQFCDAKSFCTAYGEESLSELPVESGESVAAVLEFPAVESLTDEQIRRVYEVSGMVKDFLKAVEKHVYAATVNGSDAFGTKLVQTLGNRTWKDPAVAEKYLRNKFKKDEVLIPKLITAPQAEKLLKKTKAPPVVLKKFDSLVAKPLGKKALVPISDPRPSAVEIDVETEFE